MQTLRTADMPAVGHVMVSCVVAESRVVEESVDAALRRADEALHLAQQGGRNRFHVAMPPAPSAAVQAASA